MYKLLFLLASIRVATNSYALDHYCKDSKNVGRAAYACQAETALRQVVHGVNKGEMTLQLNRGGHLRLG